MASKAQKAAGGGIAVALLLAVPLVAKWEGKRNDPYVDIVGVKTVCFGETRVAMRRYSDAECTAMLQEAVKGFAEPVARCTPMIANRPYQLAAASSLAYNIGVTLLGGFAPTILAWLVTYSLRAPSIYYIAVAVLSVIGLILARRIFGSR